MIAEALEIYRTEGAAEFLSATWGFVAGSIVDQWLRLKYRVRYGELAPRPDERLWIDPQTIEYTLASEDLYQDDQTYPRFGILDGSWDLQKNYWRDSVVWGGLRERFEEGLPWPETTYYRYSTTRLDTGDDLPHVDGPQTRANFEAYLESLDELYEEIRTEGYDPSSVITVHVGRDGEWMVGHGNHRRTIASIAGVEAVPVRVKYRHREWQELRRRVYEASSIDELSDVEEHLGHPDVPDGTFADRPDEGRLNHIGQPRSTDRGGE